MVRGGKAESAVVNRFPGMDSDGFICVEMDSDGF